MDEKTHKNKLHLKSKMKKAKVVLFLLGVGLSTDL
jgi:hypothetical protein